MEPPIGFVKPSVYRSILDKISEPILYSLPPISLSEYYNRGSYRFVYKVNNNLNNEEEVIKIFKVCWWPNPYFGPFYNKAKKDVNTNNFEGTLLEKITLKSSLAITALETETYNTAKYELPSRITPTKYGIVMKSRFGITYYRPASIQPFIDGRSINSLIINNEKIRDELIDDSAYSTYRRIELW